MYIMYIYICNYIYIYISVCVPGISRTFHRKKIGNVKCFSHLRPRHSMGPGRRPCRRNHHNIYIYICIYNYIYSTVYVSSIWGLCQTCFNKKQWFMALGKFHRYMASILSGHEICNVELRHPNASKAKPQQGQLPSSVKWHSAMKSVVNSCDVLI